MRQIRGFLRGFVIVFFVLVAFRNPPAIWSTEGTTLSFLQQAVLFPLEKKEISQEAVVDVLTETPTPTPSATPIPTVVLVKSLVQKKSTLTPIPTSAVLSTVDSSIPYNELFRKYSEQFRVDASVLISIARCESGMRSTAINGPYLGLYQYLPTTWESTRNAMGENPDHALRINPEEAIKTTAWKIANGGIGAWPVCGKRV
jgi:soluble lytic murein transglycosylase-like protein